MERYIEIPLNVKYDSRWFVQLRDVMKDYHVAWQRDYFHITVAFFMDISDKDAYTLCDLISEKLRSYRSVDMTFGKLDAFTTSSGKMHIIYLSPLSESIMPLITAVRDCMTQVECDYNPDFKLHITLGRVDGKHDLSQVKTSLCSVTPKPFTLRATCLRMIDRIGHKVLKSMRLS